MEPMDHILKCFNKNSETYVVFLLIMQSDEG